MQIVQRTAVADKTKNFKEFFGSYSSPYSKKMNNSKIRIDK